MEKLESLIKTYYDFPKKGIAFKDVLGIIQDPEVFRELIIKMSSNHVIQNSEAIISIEARGFIFGSAISYKLGLPFVPIRKKGKLPGKVVKQKYKLEYGIDEIQVHKNSITSRDKVLIVDDLIATGGTASAAAKLISKLGVKKIEFFMIIDLWNLKGSKKISKSYQIRSLMKAEG